MGLCRHGRRRVRDPVCQLGERVPGAGTDQQKIERIRGVSCEHALNRLLEYELIEEVGRLDAPGKPLLFGTTEQFLRSFGISSLTDLPDPGTDRVEEFREEAEKEVDGRLEI